MIRVTDKEVIKEAALAWNEFMTELTKVGLIGIEKGIMGKDQLAHLQATVQVYLEATEQVDGHSCPDCDGTKPKGRKDN